MDSRSLVRSFISETFFVENFADGDSFLQCGIIDSSGMLDLVAFIERTFSIRIDSSEFIPENLDSVDNVCYFVDRRSVQAG